MMAAPGRLARALSARRARAQPVETDVDEAVAVVARRLRAIWTSTGPTRCRSTCPGQMSLGAVPGEQAGQGLRADHLIESNSRLCMAGSAGTGYKLSLGADGPPGSYEDFDHADVFFVIGPTWRTATRSSSCA